MRGSWVGSFCPKCIYFQRISRYFVVPQDVHGRFQDFQGGFMVCEERSGEPGYLEIILVALKLFWGFFSGFQGLKWCFWFFREFKGNHKRTLAFQETLLGVLIEFWGDSWGSPEDVKDMLVVLRGFRGGLMFLETNIFIHHQPAGSLVYEFFRSFWGES